MKQEQQHPNMSIHYLYFLFFILLFSCTERIDIRTDDAPPQLVIYGYLTTETTAHTISITRSTGYFATDPPERISNATVRIITEDGVVIPLKKTGEDVYQTGYDVCGEEGKTYKLEVTLDFDNDGEEEMYEATSYLPYAVRIDSVSLALSTVFKDVMEVLVTGYLPEKQQDPENYYSIHIFGNDALLNDSLKGFQIFDDKHLNTREITNLACFYLDQDEEDTKVNPGDRVTLQIDAITKAYADFIREAQSEVRGSIPIFSGPPANVTTNIKCTKGSVPVSGFFTAFSRTKKSTFYQK